MIIKECTIRKPSFCWLVGGWGETNLHPSKQKKIMTKKLILAAKKGGLLMWALYRSPPSLRYVTPNQCTQCDITVGLRCWNQGKG